MKIVRKIEKVEQHADGSITVYTHKTMGNGDVYIYCQDFCGGTQSDPWDGGQSDIFDVTPEEWGEVQAEEKQVIPR